MEAACPDGWISDHRHWQPGGKHDTSCSAWRRDAEPAYVASGGSSWAVTGGRRAIPFHFCCVCVGGGGDIRNAWGGRCSEDVRRRDVLRYTGRSSPDCAQVKASTSLLAPRTSTTKCAPISLRYGHERHARTNACLCAINEDQAGPTRPTSIPVPLEPTRSTIMPINRDAFQDPECAALRRNALQSSGAGETTHL